MAITFPTNPSDGQTFTDSNVVYRYSAARGYWITVPLSSNTTTQFQRDSFVATAGQTVYTFNYDSNAEIQVVMNGLVLRENDYTATNGTSITFTDPLAAGDQIDIFFYPLAVVEYVAPTAVNDLTDVVITSPSADETLVYNGSQWVNQSAAKGVTTYTAIANLPLSGSEQGDLAYVSENNTLYMWNGSGWYSIALINESPSISVINNLDIIIGQYEEFTISVIDPEGFPVTYSYNANNYGDYSTIAKVDDTFTITGTAIGSFHIDFSASDGINISAATTTVNIVNPTFAAFNPSDTQSGTTFSINNTRMVAGYRYGTTRGNFALTSGKWYWEMYNEVQNNSGTGITDSTYTLPDGTISGTHPGGAGWSGWHVQAPGSNSGDIVSIAVDVDNQLVWFGINGVWTGDPTTGTGGTPFTGASVTSYAGDGTSGANAIWRCNYGQDGSFGGVTTSGGYTDLGAGDFKYEVPTGFSSINQITATLI